MNPLADFRKSKGLSQAKMAAVLGVSISMYEKVEAGIRNLSPNFLKKLKAAFPDVDLNIFFA